MHTPHWAIEQYERGHLNKTEKFLQLATAVTEENAAGFVASLSRKHLREVKAYINGCPRTDEGWSKLRFYHIVSCVRRRSAEEVEAERAEELHLHRRGVELLRDVIGPQVVVDPSVLAWRGGTIPKLVRAIHDERRWEDLPVLADALEEAGCDDEELVNHCRKQGRVHVRGCWLLGLLLGLK
jgi:hypothetical protein